MSLVIPADASAVAICALVSKMTSPSSTPREMTTPLMPDDLIAPTRVTGLLSDY